MESRSVSSLRSPGDATDFELWIRMATDNKINATNSWDFALIDFFHDLSLLREGGSINFQKASATLDGCVKIYSSRVDSAATETGKLLSGLAASKYYKPNIEEVEEDSEQNLEEDNNSLHIKRKKNLVLDSTLKPFESIQAKKIDSEFAVDPVFKKTLSDFDEGGAKSLLLNMLNIDSSGRILFDTTSDSKILAIDNSEREESGIENTTTTNSTSEIDMDGLERFFDNLDGLNELQVCPSMNAIQEIVYKGPDKNNILEQIEKQRSEKDVEQYEDFRELNNAGSVFFDNEDYDIGNDNSGLGDNSTNVTLLRLFDETFQREQKEREGIEEIEDIPDYDLLAYFDQALRRNWTKGHEHWKVKNLKNKRNENDILTNNIKESTKIRIKDFLTIDFLNETEIDEDELFSESVARIIIPKNQWITDDKHCLPSDIQFTSKRLIHLFMKPLTTLKTFNKRKIIPYKTKLDYEQLFADEEYWSQKYKEDEDIERSRRMDDILREDLQELHQSYDQSFFHDTNMQNFDDDNDFIDPMDGGNLNGLYQGYGSQLVTSQNIFKPTYINFSKVAKRIDVKLLKNNLWEILQLGSKFNIRDINDDNTTKNEEHGLTDGKEQLNIGDNGRNDNNSNDVTKFSEVLNDLTSKYSKEEKNDLSTSFCFICLLHLANENGFTIENTGDTADLLIKNMIDINEINDNSI